MLKMTGFDTLFAAAGNLYLLLMLVCIGVVMWRGKTWTRKAIYAALVFALFMAPITPSVYRGMEYRSKLATAQALFDERCKTAGEKVYRTVEGVEGFIWGRWRPTDWNVDRQFDLTDPYGYDCGAEECIKPMLRVTSGKHLNIEETQQHSGGYDFVETIDPRDKVSYRYSGSVRLPESWTVEKIAEHKEKTGSDVPSFSYRFALSRQPVKAFSARYSVTWDDISTPEDRNYWIAGGLIRIVDRETKQTVAERVGYLMDPGQGGVGGQRSPWTWAQAYTGGCPSHKEHNLTFIKKVLKPSKGE